MTPDTDLLSRLLDRSAGRGDVVRPRLRSLFDPQGPEPRDTAEVGPSDSPSPRQTPRTLTRPDAEPPSQTVTPFAADAVGAAAAEHGNGVNAEVLASSPTNGIRTVAIADARSRVAMMGRGESGPASAHLAFAAGARTSSEAQAFDRRPPPVQTARARARPPTVEASKERSPVRAAGAVALPPTPTPTIAAPGTIAAPESTDAARATSAPLRRKLRVERGGAAPEGSASKLARRTPARPADGQPQGVLETVMARGQPQKPLVHDTPPPLWPALVDAPSGVTTPATTHGATTEVSLAVQDPGLPAPVLTTALPAHQGTVLSDPAGDLPSRLILRQDQPQASPTLGRRIPAGLMMSDALTAHGSERVRKTPDPPVTVTVTIGRVEILAKPLAAPQRPARSASAAPDLDTYLRERTSPRRGRHE